VGELAYWLASNQASRDGNRRTARFVTQAFLADNLLGFVSSLNEEDGLLARRLNRVVEDREGSPADFTELFRRRYRDRRRRGV
jgi:prophage maintenance system killer protein